MEIYCLDCLSSHLNWQNGKRASGILIHLSNYGILSCQARLSKVCTKSAQSYELLPEY